MSNLANQRRIAASLLKCGANRVWFDPDRLNEIQNAISREDLRGLIETDAIAAHQKKGVSRGRARVKIAQRSYGHRRGPGRRRGAAGARHPGKRQWIKRIRAIRRVLVELRDTAVIEPHTYRVLYRKAAGGQFRNIAHLRAQLEIMTGRMK